MLVAKDLTKYIAGQELFHDLSFVIHAQEKVGLIGPNGCGKSTLMKMILGRESTDGGKIELNKEKVGYLPQKVEFEEGEMVRDYLKGWPAWEIGEILYRVGLPEFDQNMLVAKLSGGQKTRLAMARLLLEKPTIIMMDEPTNHLDLDGIEWLEKICRSFNGGLLIVSHDRKFLDNAISRILEIDPVRDGLFEYTGNYTAYLEQKAVERERWEIDYAAQQRKKNKMETWIHRRREMSKTNSDPALGKQLRQMERRLQREVMDHLIAKPQDYATLRQLILKGQVHSDKLVVRVRDLAKSYGDRKLFAGVNFELRGPERLLLTGPNGAGKSTLLKIILGQVEADSGEVMLGDNVRIGYFAQEQEILDPKLSVMENFLAGRELEIGISQARSVLAAFKFPADDAFKPVKCLSYGERVRLIFAKLASSGNHLLILDEPSNHLDIPSREVIEQSLRDFQGAMILVSHDRYFVEQLHIGREMRIAGTQ